MNSFIGLIKDLGAVIIAFFCICAVLFSVAFFSPKNEKEVSDFKDGIQNHLVWSIKNECYFVKPRGTSDVLLIRVVDCDRK